MKPSRPAALGNPETTVLRELVRANAANGIEARDLSTVSPDWTRLLDAAERHRLAPLVLEGLQRGRHSLPPVPESQKARLKNLRNLEIAKAIVRLHHIDELGEVALDEGLRLYLLKGAAFATTLYPDPGLRPMSDIDVLAPPGEFETWSHELSKLGYSLLDVSDHASAYRREGTGVVVELHRDLTSSAGFLGLDPGAMVSRARPAAAHGESRLWTLSWEDHLLHLCVHASFQHGFRQAGLNAWDAVSIVERPEFDFDSFVALGRAERLAPWVFGGLRMSEATFESPKLSRLRSAIEVFVSRAVRQKALAFRAERLLAPGPDAVFGTPFRRLGWTGWNVTTLSLLLEISRPRTPERAQGLGARLSRTLQLLSNHGLALSASTSKTEPALLTGPIPASLGEVRDV